MVFSYIIAVSENPVRKCATNNAVVFTSHHKNFRSSLVYTGLGQAIGSGACTHVDAFCSITVRSGITFCEVAISKTSHLEAHAGFFRLLIKGIFDPYVL